MFENYTFKKQDLKAIERAIGMAYDEKLKHVFARGLGGFDLVSYDSRFIYLWSRNDYPNLEKLKDSVCHFKIYRLPHKRELEGLDFRRMGLITGDFRLGGKYFGKLPQKIFIQATPLTAWLKQLEEIHNIPRKDLPYEKKYYGIILLHEIAHFYFFKKLKFKNTTQGKVLKLAKDLVKGHEKIRPLTKKGLSALFIPKDTRALSEAFSTLVELEATKIFYPKFLKKTIGQMVKYSKKHLEDEVGEIETAINANLYGKIVAISIFKSFPNWSERLHKLI